MKTITITSKVYGECVLLFDDVDYLKIMKCGYKICLHKNPRGMHVKVRNVLPHDPRKKFFIHRLIMDVIDENLYVDHKDGNGLNNQKSNLRIATPSQNSMNRASTALNRIGYKGVSKLGNRYVAKITVGGKKVYGGMFINPEDAARRYNELAREHHGEFAYQNPV